MKLSLPSAYARNHTSQAGNGDIKAGQIIKGAVKQLYPGQQAAVAVNGRVYHASLEAPVETGKSYYFQVKNEHGRQIWQVAVGGTAETSADKSQVLLKQLDLSSGKQEQYIFRMFEQMQLPVTSETLQKSVQLLKSEGAVNKQGMQTLQWMLAAGAPLKTSIFQSIHQVLHGTSPAEDMAALLERHRPAEALHQSLKNAVLTPESFKGNLEAPTKPLQLFAATAAVAANDKNGQARQLIHQLFSGLQPPLNAEAFLQHLRQGIGSSGSMENWLQAQVKDAGQMHQTVQQAPGVASQLNVQALMKAWHPLVPEAGAVLDHMPQMVKWLTSHVGSTSWAAWAESGSKEAMQAAYRHLEQAQTHIMSRNELSPQHERTVAHVAGQQLMQQADQDAWLQQLSHLPAKWGEMLSDAVVHWEGKRTEDGKLDPDTCHILFQLEMDRLGVLIADVQIYKRNVTVNISSENPHPERTLHLLQPMLKTAMASLNYQLVSLQWHEEEAVAEKPRAQQSRPRGAFDVRI
ncbi:hypothetical protein CHL76_03440 [Marinococcus halophilus]|uniref:Flagellar hook-length control protein-like C-terminal domain-containing protein n=1 Tax=Marinococcus halophilus TaxID=1371 RepID=A0A510Y236_MARHA|nr:hypothetical protein [Marinococcus halophilus]OZT81421.1 hypothetical protein CHL76_03440 [Marinococcus halophilus]GEK57376.1 hypothetical protein MHA01_02810 [Marinococcus halophilus]